MPDQSSESSESSEIHTKAVLISGAASGIGMATATRLLHDGFRVALCDKDPNLQEIFADEINDGIALAVVGDLTQERMRGELLKQIKTRFGRLDALVNNAGVGGNSASVETLDLADLTKTLEVNLISVIALTQQAIPLLKQSPAGRIVNVGSVFGDEPVANSAPYCVSKGAIHTFTRVLATELGRYGITCNTVAPGYIMTAMHVAEVEAQARAMGTTSEERFTQLRAEVLLGRHGEPEDVSSTISWLLHEESSYITGQKLQVNGGTSFS